MRRDDVLDILSKIAPTDLPKTVLVLRFGSSITLDAVARAEGDYVIVRGREAGTNDEARAFFVPFEEVIYVKLDRVTAVSELKRMYGEQVPADEEEVRSAEARAAKAAVDVATPAPAVPTAPMDPAAIAKQNLLARIRAARSIAAG